MPLLYFAGSNAQISLPVAAFSATAFRLGVVMYITPLTTTGLTCIVDRSFASPVLYPRRARDDARSRHESAPAARIGCPSDRRDRRASPHRWRRRTAPPPPPGRPRTVAPKTRRMATRPVSRFVFMSASAGCRSRRLDDIADHHIRRAANWTERGAFAWLVIWPKLLVVGASHRAENCT